eukprot:1417513-Lingulodinium_polyedra.AAC.1
MPCPRRPPPTTGMSRRRPAPARAWPLTAQPTHQTCDSQVADAIAPPMSAARNPGIANIPVAQ